MVIERLWIWIDSSTLEIFAEAFTLVNSLTHFVRTLAQIIVSFNRQAPSIALQQGNLSFIRNRLRTKRCSLPQTKVLQVKILLKLILQPQQLHTKKRVIKRFQSRGRLILTWSKYSTQIPRTHPRLLQI